MSGAGTSQGGQVLGEALVLDTSKYLTNVTAFDPANQTVMRDMKVVENELCRVDALIAEFLKLATCRKPFALFGNEQAHPFVTRLNLGVGLDQ